MPENLHINWQKESERLQFEQIGILDFADFWNLGNGGSPLKTKTQREHIDRSTGKITRKTVQFNINGSDFFLKRSCGNSFQCMRSELEAIRILPQFGLLSAPLAAHASDFQNKQGFILLNKLNGFYSLSEILKQDAPQNIIAGFQKKKKDFFDKIMNAVNKLNEADYFYPDLMEKHLFFNVETEDIALIDLERFLHISQCPWSYRFKIIKFLKKQKELKALRKILKSEFLTWKDVEETTLKTT